MPNLQPLIDAIAARAEPTFIAMFLICAACGAMVVWLVRSLMGSNRETIDLAATMAETATALKITTAETNAILKTTIENNTTATSDNSKGVIALAHNFETLSQRVADALSRYEANERDRQKAARMAK